MRLGRPPTHPEVRFWAKVEKTDGCWNWTAATSGGYGMFWFGGVHRMAHRYSYERSVGPIAAGLQLDHLCRNRACVNPSHLEPVTPRVNVLRGETIVAANLKKTKCANGHDYSGENLLVTKTGHRQCRKCMSAAGHRYLARTRAAIGHVPLRLRTSCKRGHAYTAENTGAKTRGGRFCRRCSNDSIKRCRDRKKENTHVE